MAFDRVSGSILAVEQTSETAAQTWAWDGSRWRRLQPPDEPAGSASMAMAETADGLLLVSEFGDLIGGPASVGTWTWNGHAWTLRFVWPGLPAPALASGSDGGNHRVWAVMDLPPPPTSTCIASTAVWEWVVDRWTKVWQQTGNSATSGCE
jgi:hypothetical protein